MLCVVYGGGIHTSVVMSLDYCTFSFERFHSDNNYSMMASISSFFSFKGCVGGRGGRGWMICEDSEDGEDQGNSQGLLSLRVHTSLSHQ